MDGTGISGHTLDTTKLNVFKINFQYLGAGNIHFYIEDPDTGEFQEVHMVKYAGTAQIPSLIDPTMHMTIIAKTESGYSGSALEMRTASMAGFIEGKESGHGIRNAASTEKTMSTTQQVLFIIHNEVSFNSLKNKVTVYPDFITLSTEATKPVEVKIIANPTRIDGGAALTNVDSASSVMQYGNTGTTISGGETLAVFEVEAGSPVEMDFKAFETRLRPGERWVLTGQISSGSNALCKAGISWQERI
jgi:hypothetical protein